VTIVGVIAENLTAVVVLHVAESPLIARKPGHATGKIVPITIQIEGPTVTIVGVIAGNLIAAVVAAVAAAEKTGTTIPHLRAERTIDAATLDLVSTV
jgi:hypothetical protein